MTNNDNKSLTIVHKWKKANGKYGIEYSNGDKYIGGFHNGLLSKTKEGQGIYYYKNGDRYEGEFRNDKRNGKGIFYYKKSGDRYEGEFRNGNIYGKGIYYRNDGDRYEGEFRNGNIYGKGIYYYENGDKYEGYWKNGNIEGQGIFYYKKSGNKYEGDWKNGKKEGQGIYYFKNGDIYKGDFRNDNIEDQGIYYYKNGNKYVGDWKNGKKDGKGTVYYNDRNKYEGYYKNGILINGKEYYKSMPKKRKDVFLQINEDDEKAKFLYKHEDGDFIYTDGRQTGNTINKNTNYDHLKIMYEDHGNENRKLTKNIDKKLFEQYKKKNLKSVYISSLACHGGYYDSNGNNLFKIVANMMTSGSSNCVGFVSLMKAKNSTIYDQTTNKNGKKGEKRVPARKENIENLSDPNYDKNNDFEYYCIIKENEKQKVYQIPAQLCYWREKLIDDKKFMDAFNALKEGKDYKFEAEVISNDGKSNEINMEITIPSVWGIDKDNRVKEVNVNVSEEEQEIEESEEEQEIEESNNSIANKNLKDTNIQNQLG